MRSWNMVLKIEWCAQRTDRWLSVADVAAGAGFKIDHERDLGESVSARIS